MKNLFFVAFTLLLFAACTKQDTLISEATPQVSLEERVKASPNFQDFQKLKAAAISSLKQHATTEGVALRQGTLFPQAEVQALTKRLIAEFPELAEMSPQSRSRILVRTQDVDEANQSVLITCEDCRSNCDTTLDLGLDGAWGAYFDAIVACHGNASCENAEYLLLNNKLRRLYTSYDNCYDFCFRQYC